MVSIGKSIIRYQLKNTISGQYKRHKLKAELSALATGAQLLRFPSWQIHDISITSFLGAFAIDNFRKALTNLRDLKPIKNRALQIKKAAKLANKNKV